MKVDLLQFGHDLAHVEPVEYRLGPEELISAYRGKNRIEEAFKEVKSVLEFQPTFVYTDEHDRAHYTICVLSYLLDMILKELAAQDGFTKR